MKKKKVFYYYMSGTGGGADHSLFNLIKNLNGEKFEPFVYYNRENHFNDKLQNLGVKLIKGKFNNSGKKKESATKEKLKTRSVAIRKTKLFYYSYSMPKLIIRSFPEILRFYKLIKKHKIDIVHVNHSLNERSQIIAGLLAGANIFAHYRGLVKPEKLDVFLSRFVKKIICISEFVKRDYVSHGIDPRKCVVIHNGVDTSEFAPHNKPANKKLIIANIGRLEEWKGQRIFLEAAAEIVKERKDLKFLIIGNGSNEKILKDLVLKLNIEEYVEFKGFVEDISSLLEKIDILVHSSIEPEPFGRVIIEGMAAGLPVIATDIGGPREIIDNGINGMLIPEGNPSALFEKIVYLIENKKDRYNLGKLARKHVDDYFDVKKTTLQIEKVYCL